MNIFHESDYRKIIRELVEHKKTLDSKFNFQRLSEACGIQKAYLSQVLQGARDLSRDQLFAVNRYLELSQEEASFMELLLEYARSARADRRELLLAEIQTIQRKHLKTEKNLSVKEVAVSGDTISQYYLDPYHQLIHIALDIPRFRKEPQALAQAFSLPKARLRELLGNLERMKIIKSENGEIKVLLQNIHLPKNSPLFWAWKSGLMQMALQYLRSGLEDQERAYSFSVVFAAEEEVRLKVQKLFLDFLKEAKGLVGDAKSKHVYQMNFDLFPWA
jgi:uncharacterized protein (TIGR02147 family)